MTTPKVWHKLYDEYNIAKDISLPSTDTSLLDIFERNRELFATRTAFIHGTHRLSFETLGDYSDKLAAFLQGLGFAQGERVAIMLPNSLQYPVVVQAILKAGFIVVNVNPLYTPFELKHQLNDAGVKVIIIWDNVAPTLAQILHETSIEHILISQINDLYDDISHSSAPADATSTLPNAIALTHAISMGNLDNYTRPTLMLDDIAVLQYTGGTTGLSKGAKLSHKNFIANLLQLDEWFSSKLGGKGASSPDYPFFCALPLYHIFTFTAC